MKLKLADIEIMYSTLKRISVRKANTTDFSLAFHLAKLIKNIEPDIVILHEKRQEILESYSSEKIKNSEGKLVFPPNLVSTINEELRSLESIEIDIAYSQFKYSEMSTYDLTAEEWLAIFAIIEDDSEVLDKTSTDSSEKDESVDNS